MKKRNERNFAKAGDSLVDIVLIIPTLILLLRSRRGGCDGEARWI